MKRSVLSILVLVVVMCCTTRFVHAAGIFKWVEVDVALQPDYKAAVTYSVCLRSTGDLHGFYFQRVEETPVFDTANALAWYDNNQRSMPLEIKPMSGKKWDIVLAGGQDNCAQYVREPRSCQTGRFRRVRADGTWAHADTPVQIDRGAGNHIAGRPNSQQQ